MFSHHFPNYYEYSEAPPPGVDFYSSSTIDDSSVEQIWFKAWAKARNLTYDKPKQPTLSVSNLRKKILEAKKELERLKEALEELKNSKNAESQEWKSLSEKFEKTKAEFESNISFIFDRKFIDNTKAKLAKNRRHKKWNKKHIKKLQEVRDQRQRQRETLHKTIDKWRTEWIAKDLAMKREQIRKNEADRRVQEAEAKKNRHKELSKLLEKVKKLRDIRRDRLKREGHFFPEEDDEFFNKIASLNDAMKIEEERLDQERNAAAEQKRNEAMHAGMKERERERDPTYEYWHQAEFDIDNLVSIRRQWDAYLIAPGKPASSCIPPMFVTPSPPANYIWASCLIHDQNII
ncbi:9164_t:CDS:2 [Diversispora eburnea]|uniref:9164_t:CDS:1 n=2 Tax=Diversisporales TaxID=214509 RepID=A0A9N8VDQ9_9GLOM|nr:9164_t:CDS:2 [Diversispora eburnea]